MAPLQASLRLCRIITDPPLISNPLIWERQRHYLADLVAEGDEGQADLNDTAISAEHRHLRCFQAEFRRNAEYRSTPNGQPSSAADPLYLADHPSQNDLSIEVIKIRQV